MFSVNVLEEMAGTKPELVHREPACQGLGHRALYEGTSLFQCCASKHSTREKIRHKGNGYGHEFAPQRHTQLHLKLLQRAVAQLKSLGTTQEWRPSAVLVAWWRVYGRNLALARLLAKPSSGPGTCWWTDCPNVESRNDLRPGCCKGGCTSTSIMVCTRFRAPSVLGPGHSQH